MYIEEPHCYAVLILAMYTLEKRSTSKTRMALGFQACDVHTLLSRGSFFVGASSNLACCRTDTEPAKARRAGTLPARAFTTVPVASLAYA